MTVIKKTFTTKNEIPGGKVFVSWRGDNIDAVEEKLKKALESVQRSKKETVWVPNADYIKSDEEEAARKEKRKQRGRTVFSMRIG